MTRPPVLGVENRTIYEAINLEGCNLRPAGAKGFDNCATAQPPQATRLALRVSRVHPHARESSTRSENALSKVVWVNSAAIVLLGHGLDAMQHEGAFGVGIFRTSSEVSENGKIVEILPLNCPEWVGFHADIEVAVFGRSAETHGALLLLKRSSIVSAAAGLE